MASSPVMQPPQAPARQPLGLPAGSVRAAISLMIVAIFWLLLILPPARPVTIPLYLYFLLALILVFFASHGTSISRRETGHPSPWHLPHGTFPWLMILGTVAVLVWTYHTDPSVLRERLTPDPEQIKDQWPFLLMSLLGGYLLGWIARHGPWHRTYWFQDIQAWISLLAVLFLTAEIIIRLFINPSLEESLNLTLWECVLVAIVSFYFGVRS